MSRACSTRASRSRARSAGGEYSRGRMRILVTGADGFIGSHVATALAEAGHVVLSIVYGRAPEQGELRIDLARPDALRQLPDDVEAVVHAAGAVDGHASYARMYAANVRTTELLAGWASLRKVAHFVHLSSVAVYGPLALGEERDERTRGSARAWFPTCAPKRWPSGTGAVGVPFTRCAAAVLGAATRWSPRLPDALCHEGAFRSCPERASSGAFRSRSWRELRHWLRAGSHTAHFVVPSPVDAN